MLIRLGVESNSFLFSGGGDPRVSCMLGKCIISKLHFPPNFLEHMSCIRKCSEKDNTNRLYLVYFKMPLSSSFLYFLTSS